MSIDCYCKGHENYYECPVNYLESKPNFSVPAIPISIRYGGYVLKWCTIIEHGKSDKITRYWEGCDGLHRH